MVVVVVVAGSRGEEDYLLQPLSELVSLLLCHLRVCGRGGEQKGFEGGEEERKEE